MAVIGLGRFGQSLALELMDDGVEVLGIDAREDVVQSLDGRLTHVVRADATDEQVLRQLAVPEFGRVVIAIGSDIESSILVASLLRRFAVPTIWAKAVSDAHGLILEQLGVSRVVSPEKDMGRRVAHLVRGTMQDFIEIDADFAMVKTALSPELAGTRLGDSGIRRRYGVTVTSVKHRSGAWQPATQDTVLREGDVLLVTGPVRQAERFSRSAS
ncbi:TrkA family potassium uptake protein [Brachybacterium saurashtrense]|uniref:TrkA family potassium uptake protein n=1 Tax=Brachybacterium saurashtrense TaxID=556288 RepID=A0A345YQQ8_9MICO|nr:TrkA family potassium uptake protein [Brachybacterium saurashtrense]RRR24000.1 TrkA family potassium uptake protein [Brachybacterium saurashtrense]